MSERLKQLSERLSGTLSLDSDSISTAFNEITIVVPSDRLLAVCESLRDDAGLRFEMLIDVAGVDYLEYGLSEWSTEEATAEGFSRGVEKSSFARFKFEDAKPGRALSGPRYSVVYHLLSVQHNWRLRVKCFCTDDEYPMAPSVTAIWPVANWFEREAFDLYGIVFEGHPDLRRILTDYGFIGHPFRKDFPLVGNVEMRYDPDKGRVVYEPVTIEPRVLVPKTVRHDNRYLDESNDDA